VWLIPVQALGAFTIWAVTSGGQAMRTWMMTALVWLMTVPLLVSVEASLVAMMVFEPLRGLLRRAQYLFLEYNSQDPIHVLTPIVTVFALAVLLRSKGLGIVWATPMARWVSLLALIYALQIFNPLQGGVVVGLSGAMFTLAPLVWFYFGQFVTDDFITKTLRLMIVVGLVTSLWGVYQLVFGYPAFEQYWIANTDFYNSINVGHVERALATFSSAEEWGRYAELGAIAAFGFVSAHSRLRGRLLWALAGLTLIGFVLLSGQRSAVFGLALGLVVLLTLRARNLSNAIARLSLVLIPLVLVMVFVKAPEMDEIWSNDETDTVSTVLSHTQRGVLKPVGEDSLQERLKNWTWLMTDVIPKRPLGTGIGAGTLSEWRFNQDAEELPPIDSSILLNAITVGIPGVLLFIWILSRTTWLSIRNARQSKGLIETTIAAMICALVLNAMFGMTYTLYSVAPLAWMFTGWVGAKTHARSQSDREVLTI
jgi:hypothetical protein